MLASTYSGALPKHLVSKCYSNQSHCPEERDTGTGGGETSILQVGDKEGRIQNRAREAVLHHRTDPCPRPVKHKPPSRPGFRVLQTPTLPALQPLLGAGVLAGAPQEEPPGWPQFWQDGLSGVPWAARRQHPPGPCFLRRTPFGSGCIPLPSPAARTTLLPLQ